MANEETLLRKQLFARALNICFEQKMFLNFFRDILRPQQMFPRLLAEETMLIFQGLFSIARA